jgi:hypothetical protein
MPKGRPGGNPAIQEYKFDAKYDYGDETCSERLTLRMPPSLKEKLKAGIVPDWQEVARRALLDAIAQLQGQTEKPPEAGATELESGQLASAGEEEPTGAARKRTQTPTRGRTQTTGKKQQRGNTQANS